jgi:amino acid adenylation domain-containing protein
VYVFSTSYAQRSLWFLHQLAPESPFYNLHAGTRIRTPLNVVALEESVNEIVRRHESLRTAFKVVDDEPTQVITPTLHIALPVSDLSELPENEQNEQLMQIAEAQAGTPFDLSRWPLVRMRLVKLADADYVLLRTVHHIVCDYWAMDIFDQELSAEYEARSAGRPSPLVPLAIQYADYAEWERGWMSGPVARSHLEYWKCQLADVQQLVLPTDHRRPEVPTFEGAEYDFEISAHVSRALTALGQRESVTLFMTTLAAFQTLLHRYSGQTDIVIGTPVANRNRPEVQDLIGFFANSLALRTSFAGDPTFRDLLARVRTVALDAFAHQEFPFERLVSELRPDRSRGDNPVFGVHFQLFSEGGQQQRAAALEGEVVPGEVTAVKFDLALDLWESDEGLFGHLEYRTDLWTGETIARLCRNFNTLLESIVLNPDERVSMLGLLEPRERRRVVEAYNATAADYPQHLLMHQLFEAQVERTPDATAIVMGDRRLTYGELNARANRLAHYLLSLDGGPESVVAVCAHRSIELVVAFLASLKAGSAYLPLNPGDPRGRRRTILEDVRPKVILTDDETSGRLPVAGAREVSLDAERDEIARLPSTNPVITLDTGNLAYLLYTSGSTGSPKGVQIEHRAICNHLLWMQSVLPLEIGDRTMFKYPINFDASVYELFGPLIAGATVFVSASSAPWDPRAFVRDVAEQGITVLDLVPSMLDALLDDGEFLACRSVRRVVVGGEELTPSLCDRFHLHMGAELHNVYGPTEATIGATAWQASPGDNRDPVPIGRPGANTQAYVLDDALNPVPLGVVGELCIAGAGLARGYLGRADLTAERFVPNPFSQNPGARMYRTGDRARYRPGGVLEWAGRTDDQMKVRGYRVEPREAEAALERLASVRECSVVAAADEHGRTRLVAHIVPASEPPELWPSLGEYDVYDELLYYAMTHDERRVEAYRNAIARSVAGKTVLDLGTGADAVLARLCVEAGARRVYALERGEEAYRRACSLIDALGLDTTVEVISGDSTDATLPERVDVCVSEIIGTIGSSEGVVSVLNDARRFLTEEGVMIPSRCVTRFAPTTLPENLASSLTLAELPRLLVERVFSRVGRPFDLRMCIKNARRDDLLAEAATFEVLDFSTVITPEEERPATFRIQRSGRLDGFLLWVNLYPGAEEPLDSLDQRLSWLPVFLPAFFPGFEVAAGDSIDVRCARRQASDRPIPDYTLEGVVTRRGAAAVPFVYESPAHATSFRASPFYAGLFATTNGGSGARTEGESPRPNGVAVRPDRSNEHTLPLVARLRRSLEDEIPSYMVPSAFVIHDELPRTASGKIDHRALSLRSQSVAGSQGVYAAPVSEAEKVCAEVWREVLGLPQVGVRDNFFDLGGDSLSIIRVHSQLESRFRTPISVVDLFRYTTVSELARYVEQGAGHAGPGEEADDRARKRRDAVVRFRSSAPGALGPVTPS